MEASSPLWARVPTTKPAGTSLGGNVPPLSLANASPGLPRQLTALKRALFERKELVGTPLPSGKKTCHTGRSKSPPAEPNRGGAPISSSRLGGQKNPARWINSRAAHGYLICQIRGRRSVPGSLVSVDASVVQHYLSRSARWLGCIGACCLLLPDSRLVQHSRAGPLAQDGSTP